MSIKRKTVSLPSGASCIIRPQSVLDALNAQSKLDPKQLGEVQEVLKKRVARSKGHVQEGKTEEEAWQMAIEAFPEIEAERAIEAALYTIALTHRVGALQIDGQWVKIVPKEHYECGDGEMSLHEVEPEDIRAIMEAVKDIDGGKEVAEATATFPAQPEPGS